MRISIICMFVVSFAFSAFAGQKIIYSDGQDVRTISKAPSSNITMEELAALVVPDGVLYEIVTDSEAVQPSPAHRRTDGAWVLDTELEISQGKRQAARELRDFDGTAHIVRGLRLKIKALVDLLVSKGVILPGERPTLSPKAQGEVNRRLEIEGRL